ncbi:hypothetical protein EZV62_005359 [Acer yangbiense]|uniref:Pectinesterase n=1 Tax=Acer yangbiense TaxID=1000413 RepID=A0A5C7IM66_9ROSI|nr:hypothetical protein EZV62_005353 [Acer yangbiense]TXG70420.1 hypothetical protein EZV62_005355 [Acer yangbiense]TXG70423.1 hypothetical protein EZV62_005358 [Acer yangbiense]TXG70424.1 hypothetical protein EZV62_005359 [Acer yangbiense]
MFYSNNGIRRSPSSSANIINLASLLLLAIIFLSGHVVFCDDTTPIPADAGGVNGWFSTNVKPMADRKGGLDPSLAAAEESPQVIKVRKDGSGDFSNICDAINSIPSGNTKRVIIWIGAGEYVEKIKIESTKPFITFYGSPNAMPTISYSGTAFQYGTVDSASLIVDSDYFMAANIIIKNSAPKPDGVRKGAQAVALRISGTKAAFYKVRMIGFQDTLCDDKGYHFYKDCYIEGTVDFVFGRAKSLYVNTQLHVLGDTGMTVITAQARDTATEDCGYSFVHGQITGVGNGAYLGRAWMASPRVIFAYTTMSSVVNPTGWDNGLKPEREKTVYFAEYKCSGPGANPSGRVKYTKQLLEAEVLPFISLGYIQGSKWVLPPPTL